MCPQSVLPDSTVCAARGPGYMYDRLSSSHHNVFYSRLRFFSRSPSTFSRLSHRTLRTESQSHRPFLQSPRTVSPASHSQSGSLASPSRIAQSVRVARIAQSHRPVASPSRIAQSPLSSVASHSQSRSRIARSRSRIAPFFTTQSHFPVILPQSLKSWVGRHNTSSLFG
jgi:hypothetical protein